MRALKPHWTPHFSMCSQWRSRFQILCIFAI